jgi:hypothetical protein
MHSITMKITAVFTGGWQSLIWPNNEENAANRTSPRFFKGTVFPRSVYGAIFILRSRDASDGNRW